MHRSSHLPAGLLRTVALGLSSLLTAPASFGSPEPLPPVLSPALPARTSEAGARFRVLDLETSSRFNYVDRLGGGVIDRGIQYRLRIRSRLNLFGNGATYLLTRAETGRGFNNSWNETPADLNAGQTVFNLKSIGLVQRVGAHTQLSAGGLDFDHGEGGDETYVSRDGTMTGYRAEFAKVSPWLPQKLSVTAAFVGDFDKPNIFSRFRMDRANYIQVLAQQTLARRLGGSAEMDAIEGTFYSRNALRYRHPGIVDEVGVEAVMRTSGPFRFAWSSEVRKNWGSSWHTDLIYSDLPSGMYLVNGNRVLQNRGEIGLGKRLAAGASRKLTSDLQANVFAGRLLDRTPGQQWVAQAGLTYQFASLLNRALQ